MEKTNKSDYWKDIYKKSYAHKLSEGLEKDWLHASELLDKQIGKENDQRAKEYEKSHPYGFRFFFNDGTIFDGRPTASRPEELYIEFDDLLEWNEYCAMQNREHTTKELLEMAKDLYGYMKKKYHRIEIVNFQTKKVVDYIDIKNKKNETHKN